MFNSLFQQEQSRYEAYQINKSLLDFFLFFHLPLLADKRIIRESLPGSLGSSVTHLNIFFLIYIFFSNLSHQVSQPLLLTGRREGARCGVTLASLHRSRSTFSQRRLSAWTCVRVMACSFSISCGYRAQRCGIKISALESKKNPKQKQEVDVRRSRKQLDQQPVATATSMKPLHSTFISLIFWHGVWLSLYCVRVFSVLTP